MSVLSAQAVVPVLPLLALVLVVLVVPVVPVGLVLALAVDQLSPQALTPLPSFFVCCKRHVYMYVMCHKIQKYTGYVIEDKWLFFFVGLKK